MSIDKYKLLFLSLNNINDINKMCNLLELKEEDKIEIYNYFNTINLPKKISHDDFCQLLNDLNSLKFREDVLENLYKLGNKTTDSAQIKTIIRIANIKPEKYTNLDLTQIKEKNKWFYLKQKCPHCSILNIIDFEGEYSICGYNDIKYGYNWEGCGRDWCTRCGKKLCKKWNENNLYVLENRFHDSECCRIYAKKNNANYLLDFCHCYNNFVNRN